MSKCKVKIDLTTFAECDGLFIMFKLEDVDYSQLESVKCIEENALEAAKNAFRLANVDTSNARLITEQEYMDEQE